MLRHWEFKDLQICKFCNGLIFFDAKYQESRTIVSSRTEHGHIPYVQYFDTSTTADSTISTQEETKIIDWDTKISEMIEAQLQTTTDYEDLWNQQAENKKHYNEDMKNLTAQTLKLTQTIVQQHEENKQNHNKLKDDFMAETSSLRKDINNVIL